MSGFKEVETTHKVAVDFMIREDEREVRWINLVPAVGKVLPDGNGTSISGVLSSTVKGNNFRERKWVPFTAPLDYPAGQVESVKTRVDDLYLHWPEPGKLHTEVTLALKARIAPSVQNVAEASKPEVFPDSHYPQTAPVTKKGGTTPPAKVPPTNKTTRPKPYQSTLKKPRPDSQKTNNHQAGNKSSRSLKFK